MTYPPDRVASTQPPTERVPVAAFDAEPPFRSSEAVPPSRMGRFTVSLGRVLSAGCLLLGLALLLLVAIAPQIAADATGPGWTRTGWHLGIGLAAEGGQFAVRNRPWLVRLAVGVVAIVAVLVLLAVTWWR